MRAISPQNPLKAVVLYLILTLLLGLTFTTAIFAHPQDSNPSPFRVEQFVGNLDPNDRYRACRIDSHGNLLLLTLRDGIEKIAVDGSSDYKVNFREVEIPIGIHDYTIGPDDTLYVIGVALDRTGTVIYKTPPGQSTPELYQKLDGVEPFSCAIGNDGSFHLLSVDSILINQLLIGSKQELDKVFDMQVRRLQPGTNDRSAYAPLELSTKKSEVMNLISQLSETALIAGRDRGIHLLNRQTGESRSFSDDGTQIVEGISIKNNKQAISQESG
ncbi:MAG: hypothetical protein ACREBU_15810, partial [Nitrososphaera sp.]